MPDTPDAIEFIPAQRLFVLRMKTSFYALRVLGDGQVVHVGSAPLPPHASADGAWLGRLDDYEDPNYVWDQQGRRYELPTYGDVSYHDVAMKVSFPQPPGPMRFGDAANIPVRDLRLRYEGHEIRTDEQPGLAPTCGRGPRKGEPRLTLCVRLKDIGYDFRATLYYRVTPEHDVVERWVDICNNCPFEVHVQQLAFATAHLPNAHYELTRAAGMWAREFVPVRQALEQGRLLLEGRGLNTGHAANPFYLLSERGRAMEDGGAVHFGALAYGGSWQLCFEVLPTLAVRVHGGYEASDFSMSLPPGESHRTPAFALGCCGDGWGGASRRLHRFARDYVLPCHAVGEQRPVLYNGWEATYFNIALPQQLELARRAASIGAEVFCIDDGWFGARRNDRSGLGDWHVSSDVFPHGLRPLIDEVKRLGMKFGLWVEPEMVNPDSDLYRAHLEWVLHFPGRPRTESRNQLVLDFGRPEVVEHVYAALDRLLRENAIDLLKWDMNRYATETGSVAGAAMWRRHVAGVYAIIDRLRAAHPRLALETCSGGGGRVDLGILARAEQAWTSDNTDAFDRTLIQEGFSLAYPPRAMVCWVSHERNHQTGRFAPLDLRFDVAMRGTLGIGTALDKLSEQELTIYRRKIAFYKRIRLVVQEGDLYRLSAAGDEGVSIWLTVLPSGDAAVYSIVVLRHLQGVHRAPARLRGLKAGASYAVIDDDEREIGRYSGLQLMTLGMPGDTVGGGGGAAVRSRTVLLEQVGRASSPAPRPSDRR